MEARAGAVVERGLEGRTILVTRPAQQAHTLSDRIREEGGMPVVLSAIEILEVDDPRPLRSLIERLSGFDLAIFVSPNAVDKAMSLINERGGLPPWLEVATIGKGSATQLERSGAKRVIAPAGRFDSEALLAMREMQDVSGKRVVIFRGDGGRELVRDTLIARGATVEYAECYRRTKPNIDAAVLAAMWVQQEISGVVITSSEGLRNLHEMMDDRCRRNLRRTPLFVPHPRIAETARELGITRVVVTAPGDDGIVRGMIDWWRNEGAANTEG